MYATREDMVKRFGQQRIETLEKAVAKAIDPTVTDKAIQDAEELANSYIALQYDLPLPATPEALKLYVLNIALYNLYTEKAPELVRQRYEDAEKWLQRIGAKRAILQLPENPYTGTETIEATKNHNRVAVGVSHYGGVFGKEVTDLMPSIPPRRPDG